MRTNTKDKGWPIVLVVAGEHELSSLIIEIARQQEYAIPFYYDVVETPRQAVARVKQLAGYGREVIGIITDGEIIPATNLPTVKVEEGEVIVNRKKVYGKQWDVATKKLFVIN